MARLDIVWPRACILTHLAFVSKIVGGHWPISFMAQWTGLANLSGGYRSNVQTLFVFLSLSSLPSLPSPPPVSHLSDSVL